jgi:3-oxoacyl-[acyl-carrier-protein] synthase II
MNRVVVTGMGAVTPIGTGVEAYWENLVKGKSGIGKITLFNAEEFSTKIAGEVPDFDPLKYMDRKESKRLVRFIQFAIASSKLALENAGLSISSDNANDIGVLIGSGIGGIAFFEEQVKVLVTKGPSKISPFCVPWMITNMAAGMVAIATGAKGPNSCVTTACATGTHCIGDAYRILQRGEAVAMLAGGSEASITPMGVASFCSAKALSTRNDAPEKASRPFDKERNGFVMGEGSGIVVLETLEHAQSRGAKIFAEVVGYGMSGDAYHITAPSPGGEGAARAMQRALKDAGLGPQDIQHINAHGTSTQLNDKFETMAIKTVFGDHAKKIAISSTKSMIGHLLGAAGAVEFIAMVLAIVNGTVPPTVNYEVPDPECDLDYTPNKARSLDVTSAMSNSFGFGGHNAILIVKKFKP